MSKLYQIQQNQLDGLKKRLDTLESDLNAIFSDIDVADDRVKRQRLERKKTQLFEEMREVANQYDQLKAELEKFPEYQEFQSREEALSRLINLLAPISLDKVIKAYQLCLPEARIPIENPTKETLLQRLAQMPKGETGIKPILLVVKDLSQDKSLTSNQQKDLQTWLQGQGLPPETSVNEPQQRQFAQAEICLMVKIKSRFLNNTSKSYLIESALIIDPSPSDLENKITPHPLHPLSVPQPTDTKLFPAYSQDELEKVVGKLIEDCGSSIPLTDLVLQLFLPTELLNLAIEHWRFLKGRHCCGHRCKSVLVRSSERHFSDLYNPANGDWEKYWKRFLSTPNVKCIEALPMLNLEQNQTKIQPSKSQVIGCRFIEHYNPQQQQLFWEDILNQGLPIALGVRHLEITQIGITTEEAKQKAKQSMNNVIRNCSIADLPESLMKKRQQVLSRKYNSEVEQLQQSRLCLLWDNPFRPFPTIKYQSD